MIEKVNKILDECEQQMNDAINHLENELVHIRAGKATPAMLDGVMVEYYGSMTPLNQVSNISTPDARTIAIQPWEKSLISDIEKGILKANLGLNPENNGEIVRVNIPALTEERRKQLVKQVSSEGENAKISIRNARKVANDDLKKLLKEGLSEDMQKSSEEDVQEMTDKHTKRIDNLIDTKEKEILTI